MANKLKMIRDNESGLKTTLENEENVLSHDNSVHTYAQENTSLRSEVFKGEENVLSRDNVYAHIQEPLEENTSLCKEVFTKEELSEVIYAIIRKLNYMYDSSRDKNEREAILDKKARLMLELVYLEEIVDKLNYPNAKSREKK
jgi:ribosome maturation protein Sdo1